MNAQSSESDSPNICGYSDRFLYDKSWWKRWCWLKPGHLGNHFEESKPRTASEAFRAYVDIRNAERKESLIEAGPTFTLTSASVPVQAPALPASAKKIMLWVEQNPGWEVMSQHSQTHREAVLYATTEGEHNAGDVRTPEHDREHWAVQGRFMSGTQKVAEFWASWTTVLNAKGKPQTKFEHANVWDAFTGEHITESQSTPFEGWLRTFAPVGAPKPRTPRKTTEEPIVDLGLGLLDSGEWSAS